MRIFWLFLLWVKESIKGFFKNIGWNMAALLLTMFCLFGFGMSYIAGKTADNLANELGEKVEIQVNMKNTIDVSKHEDIGIQLGAIGNVNGVEYQSKEKIYDKMKEEMGKDSDILEILNENPFDARFILSMEDPNQLEQVIDKVEAMGISDNIQYGEGYVQKLLDITAIISKMGYLFTIIVAVATVYIVSTVIKFNIDQRKNEIRIKQLTGSGFFTIRIPFLFEALLITVSAGCIVYGSLVLGYEPLVAKINETIPYVTFIGLETAMTEIGLWVAILSVGIALVGTILSTSKNLEKI